MTVKAANNQLDLGSTLLAMLVFSSVVLLNISIILALPSINAKNVQLAVQNAQTQDLDIH